MFCEAKGSLAASPQGSLAPGLAELPAQLLKCCPGPWSPWLLSPQRTCCFHLLTQDFLTSQDVWPSFRGTSQVPLKLQTEKKASLEASAFLDLLGPLICEWGRGKGRGEHLF